MNEALFKGIHIDRHIECKATPDAACNAEVRAFHACQSRITHHACPGAQWACTSKHFDPQQPHSTVDTGLTFASSIPSRWR